MVNIFFHHDLSINDVWFKIKILVEFNLQEKINNTILNEEFLNRKRLMQKIFVWYSINGLSYLMI